MSCEHIGAVPRTSRYVVGDKVFEAGVEFAFLRRLGPANAFDRIKVGVIRADFRSPAPLASLARLRASDVRSRSARCRRVYVTLVTIAVLASRRATFSRAQRKISRFSASLQVRFSSRSPSRRVISLPSSPCAMISRARRKISRSRPHSKFVAQDRSRAHRPGLPERLRGSFLELAYKARISSMPPSCRRRHSDNGAGF